MLGSISIDMKILWVLYRYFATSMPCFIFIDLCWITSIVSLWLGMSLYIGITHVGWWAHSNEAKVISLVWSLPCEWVLLSLTHTHIGVHICLIILSHGPLTRTKNIVEGPHINILPRKFQHTQCPYTLHNWYLGDLSSQSDTLIPINAKNK